MATVNKTSPVATTAVSYCKANLKTKHLEDGACLRHYQGAFEPRVARDFDHSARKLFTGLAVAARMA